MSHESVWVQALRKGFAAARANLIPGLILQAVALLIILGYYYLPVFHELLLRLQHAKDSLGLPGSMLSTSLFGAVIPFLIQRYLLRLPVCDSWTALGALALFWGYKGIEIDCFYRFQAWLFGTGTDAATLAGKVAFDQFCFSAIWAVPTMAIFYIWKDCGFHLRDTAAVLRRNFWAEKVLPPLLSNWGVWIPAVTMIYCLPTPLQLPMQNLVLCIFVLLISVLTRQAAGKHPQPQAA